MKRTKETNNHSKTASTSPAATVEEREAELRLLAMDVSEERLRNGTATSQEICYWLKDGSTAMRTQIEAMQKEIDLKDAKIKSLEADRESSVEYAEVLKAIALYSGNRQAIQDDQNL